MNELFLKIINMSISASWLVLAVLIFRLVLKKAPKWVDVLLWGIVAIRLICPFPFESALSLIPSAETIPLNIGMDTTPTINSGINAINNAVNPIISQSNTPIAGASANLLQITIGIYEYIWIFGMITLALYTAISYWHLRRKIDTAVRYKDNIFQSENINSPFVLGIIKPKIYLPFKMDGQNMEHVVAHEQAHIQRKDHWWKPLGFLLLTIHWFNPLMWLAYVLLCRDIELACDEKVIKELDNEQRADYTQALVACSVNRRMIAACPLAFGEVDVKERVKSVMNYKKPALWVVILAASACVGVAVCFLTNPAISVDEQLAVLIDSEIMSHHQSKDSKNNFCCLDWEVVGKEKSGDLTTVYMWALCREYSNNNGLTVEASSHLFTAITAKEDNGYYSLVEYWIPEDGNYYSDSIKEKVPMYLWNKAMDSQRYIDKQSKELDELANEHFGITSDSASGKIVEEANNNEYQNELPTESEIPEEMMGLLGSWVLDITYTENCNNELSLQEIFGTALVDYGTSLYLGADGTIEYSMGALTGKGIWHTDGDSGRYIAELVVYPEQKDEVLTFYEFRESPDSRNYLVFDYEGHSLFWTSPTDDITELSENNTSVINESAISVVDLISGKQKDITGIEDVRAIQTLISPEFWQEEDGIPACDNDFKITINGENYWYHSDCGTVVDIYNNRYISLSGEQMNEINRIFTE